jgi:putative sterol carrier protein
MSTQEYTLAQFFPTEPWLEEYRQALEESEDLSESAAGWGVDFEGAFIFTLTDVPLARTTLGALSRDLVPIIDDAIEDLSEDRIEELLEHAPEEVRGRFERLDGTTTERTKAVVMSTPLIRTPELVWPELRAELPDIVDGLIEQVEENVTDGDTVYAYLDIHDGGCREVDILHGTDERDHGYVITGEYPEWCRLVAGEGDVLDMLTGEEFTVEGDMDRLLDYADGAVDVADTAARVESRFLF